MPTKLPSRAISAGTTLADVIIAICQADLPDRRRQELTSAVRTVARALGRRVEEVPADPRLLAHRLSEVAEVAIGLSPGRWANVKSLLRAAMSQVREMSPGRHLTPLSASWQTLWERLPTRLQKMRLSRFMHFASAAGIDPKSVTIATFAAFRTHLDASLLKDPNKTYCATIDGFRAARGAISDWADVDVARPDRGKLWVLPWSAFPESLWLDTEAWLDRISGHDLSFDRPTRPVRPITRHLREYQIRRFASALVLSGRDATTLTSLADLITIDAFTEGLKFLLRNRANKPLGVLNIGSAMKAIGRHHIGVDRTRLETMAKIIRRIDPGHRGLTRKNRERLRPLDDPQKVRALLDLPGKLMELASREHRPHAAALLAQTAVAIEILEMRPIRMRNLISLDLEKHLRSPKRSGGTRHIVIEGDETKNYEPEELLLPPTTVALIELYIDKYRPILSDGLSSALFPGKSGGAKHPNTLAEQIKRAVWTHTGLAWNPHLFRHASAKLILDNHPGAYEVARRVLGHRSIQTTTMFYAGHESAAAARHYDKIILKLRQK
jgi:integrase